MITLVDEEYVKGFLNLAENAKYNDLITFVIPIYTREIETTLTKSLVTIEDLTEDELEDIKALISVRVGCHIQMSDPTFGLQLKAFELGNVSKTFDTTKTADTWCDLFESMQETILNKYGSARVGFVKRPGVSSEYPKPY